MEEIVYVTLRCYLHLHGTLGILYVQRETSIIISAQAQSTEPILLFGRQLCSPLYHQRPILLFEKYISAQNNKVV